MKTSHTPGPWSVVPGTNCFHVKAPDWYVAKTGNDTPEAQANARLIAAAPELLEMLQAVVGLLERHVIIPVDQETGEIKNTHRIFGKDLIRIEMAKALIAKATTPATKEVRA